LIILSAHPLGRANLHLLAPQTTHLLSVWLVEISGFMFFKSTVNLIQPFHFKIQILFKTKFLSLCITLCLNQGFSICGPRKNFWGGTDLYHWKWIRYPRWT